jgi:putative FmdB family regulatory protein
MPAYDYKCDNCGIFEVRQSIKDDALDKCPTCGGAIHRLISRNVNILFKGPGFYVTDNKSSSHRMTSNGSTNGHASNSSSDSQSASTSNGSTSSDTSTSSSTATASAS